MTLDFKAIRHLIDLDAVKPEHIRILKEYMLDSDAAMSAQRRAEIDQMMRQALYNNSPHHTPNHTLINNSLGGSPGVSHGPILPTRESSVARIQSPLHRKSSHALEKLVEALPHRVLHQIKHMEFFVSRMAYVVTFSDGREEEFSDNLEQFPSDADVARVLLVCP